MHACVRQKQQEVSSCSSTRLSTGSAVAAAAVAHGANESTLKVLVA